MAFDETEQQKTNNLEETSVLIEWLSSQEKFANEELGKSAEKIQLKTHIENQLDTWPFPSIDTLTTEKIEKYKKVEFITHPLYSMMISPWENDESFEDLLFQRTKWIYEKHLEWSDGNSSFIWESYLYLLEIVEELISYSEIKKNPDTLYIFVMPNRSNLSISQKKIMDSFLCQYWSEKNTYIVNSKTHNTGELLDKDKAKLQEILPHNKPIEAQGGYIWFCLRSTIIDLCDINKNIGNKLNIIMDFVPSTKWGGSSYTDGDSMRDKEIKTKETDWACSISLKSLPNITYNNKRNPRNFREIQERVSSNAQFNEAYGKLCNEVYNCSTGEDWYNPLIWDNPKKRWFSVKLSSQ